VHFLREMHCGQDPVLAAMGWGKGSFWTLSLASSELKSLKTAC